MSYDYTCSLPPYKEKTDIAYCNEIVLTVIKNFAPITDKQISQKLGWEINRVNPRRNELVTSGKVVCAFKQPDPVSKRTVNWWAIKSETIQQKLF